MLWLELSLLWLQMLHSGIVQHCPLLLVHDNFREIFKCAFKIYGIWPHANWQRQTETDRQTYTCILLCSSFFFWKKRNIVGASLSEPHTLREKFADLLTIVSVHTSQKKYTVNVSNPPPQSITTQVKAELLTIFPVLLDPFQNENLAQFFLAYHQCVSVWNEGKGISTQLRQ